MKKALLILLLVFASAAWSQTVYITKTGEKYHKETCGHLRKSSISIDLSEAISRGYDACMTCKPPKTSAVTIQKSGLYSSPASKSVLCSAKTKKGTRCSRMTTNANGRCYQH